MNWSDIIKMLFDREILPPIQYENTTDWIIENIVIRFKSYDKITYLKNEDKSSVCFEGLFGKSDNFVINDANLKLVFDFNIKRPDILKYIRIGNSQYEIKEIRQIEGKIMYGFGFRHLDIYDKMVNISDKMDMFKSAFTYHCLRNTPHVDLPPLINNLGKDKLIDMLGKKQSISLSGKNYSAMSDAIEQIRKNNMDYVINTYF